MKERKIYENGKKRGKLREKEVEMGKEKEEIKGERRKIQRKRGK